MRTIRIYVSELLATNSDIQLSGTAANHIAKVLRMSEGDPLVLFNGSGNEYHCTITVLSKKQVCAHINSEQSVPRASPLGIHLGQVISRGDRMDFAIQKATELGVTEITPLFSERCEVKLKGDRLEKKLGHWQQIAISACEQSYRNTVPIIHPARPVTEWISQQDQTLKLVLHPHSPVQLETISKPETVSILIGPEGGFSETEVKSFEDYQFKSIALGPRVLRTETAPIVAISVLQYQWGDFSSPT